MAKAHTVFLCLECGSTHERYMGRCPDCGTFNSLSEHKIKEDKPGRTAPRLSGEKSEAVPISEIEAREEDRIASGLGEVDRVLGGGLVPGSGILLSGEPGIGKSTLLLQLANSVSKTEDGKNRFLYVTGEESSVQVKLRADRLGVSAENLWLLSECDLEAIEQQVKATSPAVVGIDSIQTVRWDDLPAGAGGVVQVREVTSRLLAMARKEGFALVLVGHVTKDGTVAGPRALEHMVDGVLQFEGERGHSLRILRGLKNRFGSSATAAILEGTRPLLLEVQALVSAAAHGSPARKCSGIDSARLSMLAAVLEKRLGVPLGGCDIHANVVGGVKLRGTAGDLALAASLLSSFHDRPLPRDIVFAGEVGLLGEVRPVPGTGQRLEESSRLGFKTACVAPGSLEGSGPTGMKIHEIPELSQLARRFVE